uniref:Protein kinase domain-containing protein n=1 Tax=Chromera velia CCMP2878 TaxID=1169474 RepID=A0A0G4I781_9ALVE|eukprot:Cvel_11623.t1-p1 / transcript=Cvel_11623.t1 / gene=Cvel_11623 / organism=Chromera_velia_CCMP2878 / gene_product=hypothetical protein / transcript_product=hypothetical protein / location=Cvel_scaffold736:26744-29454(+) / protein_length=799 / sequence_SO=supercontig / SO=protein_coding / is_pseudo=false
MLSSFALPLSEDWRGMLEDAVEVAVKAGVPRLSGERISSVTHLGGGTFKKASWCSLSPPMPDQPPDGVVLLSPKAPAPQMLSAWVKQLKAQAKMVTKGLQDVCMLSAVCLEVCEDGKVFAASVCKKLLPLEGNLPLLSHLRGMPAAQKAAVIRPLVDDVVRAHQAGFFHADIHPNQFAVEDNNANAPPRLRLMDWCGETQRDCWNRHVSDGGLFESPEGELSVLGGLSLFACCPRWSPFEIRGLREWTFPRGAEGFSVSGCNPEWLAPEGILCGGGVHRALSGLLFSPDAYAILPSTVTIVTQRDMDAGCQNKNAPVLHHSSSSSSSSSSSCSSSTILPPDSLKESQEGGGERGGAESVPVRMKWLDKEWGPPDHENFDLFLQYRERVGGALKEMGGLMEQVGKSIDRSQGEAKKEGRENMPTCLREALDGFACARSLTAIFYPPEGHTEESLSFVRPYDWVAKMASSIPSRSWEPSPRPWQVAGGRGGMMDKALLSLHGDDLFPFLLAPLSFQQALTRHFPSSDFCIRERSRLRIVSSASSSPSVALDRVLARAGRFRLRDRMSLCDLADSLSRQIEALPLPHSPIISTSKYPLFSFFDYIEPDPPETSPSNPNAEGDLTGRLSVLLSANTPTEGVALPARNSYSSRGSGWRPRGRTVKPSWTRAARFIFQRPSLHEQRYPPQQPQAGSPTGGRAASSVPDRRPEPLLEGADHSLPLRPSALTEEQKAVRRVGLHKGESDSSGHRVTSGGGLSGPSGKTEELSGKTAKSKEPVEGQGGAWGAFQRFWRKLHLQSCLGL